MVYSQEILVDNIFYNFKKELGKGALGVVCLYESKTGNKLVSKIFKKGISTLNVLLERKMQKDLQNLGFSRMPKQINYLSMTEIVSEFAEYSIEEYLNNCDIP